MSDKFHNPYHFVPVKKRTDEQIKHDMEVNQGDRKVAWGSNGHDRYAQGCHSGRLICKLTTETQVFIGARHNEGTEPKEIQPFEVDGQPAIPATTLRGLLSGIAEAASNSALRVLHRDRPLSYRYAMKHNMSALGMVLIESDEKGGNRYFLKPLAMPSLEKPKTGPNQKNVDYYVFPKNFAEKSCNYTMFFKHFQTPPLKVFIDGKGKSSFNFQNPQYYYLALSPVTFYQNKTSVQKTANLRFSSKDPDGNTAIGQKGDLRPLTEAKWLELEKNERSKFTRGIVRVMKSSERSDIPDSKNHELFIPYPVAVEKDGTKFKISDDAVRRFHMLSAERSEASEGVHPYEPVGTRPGRNGESLKLQHGDIVYFVPNSTGTEVAEISFSSIWRGYAETIEDYFKKVDPELLPFGKERKCITPAELLFGFVQDEKDKDKNANALAFKGKVRVSTGRLASVVKDPYEPEVTLKILSSPKPPSPALYFKPASNPKGGYIAKAQLKPGSHHPQGRKLYLHHRMQNGSKPWESRNNEHPNQKNRIKPLKAGLEFCFHVDFANLTDWELGLLCYALRPDESFRHKIGMGKPLGLGTVVIEIEKLERIDRALRYSPEGLQADRYVADDAGHYRLVFTQGVDAQIALALKLLGDPALVKHPVRTPQIKGKNPELETYAWFVANDYHKLDLKKKQWLKPLDGTELPILLSDWQGDEGGGVKTNGKTGQSRAGSGSNKFSNNPFADLSNKSKT